KHDQTPFKVSAECPPHEAAPPACIAAQRTRNSHTRVAPPRVRPANLSREVGPKAVRPAGFLCAACRLRRKPHQLFRIAVPGNPPLRWSFYSPPPAPPASKREQSRSGKREGQTSIKPAGARGDVPARFCADAIGSSRWQSPARAQQKSRWQHVPPA